MLSLQDQFAPHNRCFGCGPSNAEGLQIKSFVEGDVVTCKWQPKPHHLAFDSILSGGICGTLLDCHSNWAAAHHLMVKTHVTTPPCTVTAEYAVKLLKPTPMDGEIQLIARVMESSERKAVVEAEMWAKGDLTATCKGTFVAVKEGHPAYHRW